VREVVESDYQLSICSIDNLKKLGGAMSKLDDNSAFETCEGNIIHHDVVLDVSEKMPLEELIYDISELFKVFGDSTRSRIICSLSVSEMCVCDIAALLNMTSSAISHQLRILKQARIVRSRRSGKVVYYSLADSHIEQIFKIAFEHMTEDKFTS